MAVGAQLFVLLGFGCEWSALFRSVSLLYIGLSITSLLVWRLVK